MLKIGPMELIIILMIVVLVVLTFRRASRIRKQQQLNLVKNLQHKSVAPVTIVEELTCAECNKPVTENMTRCPSCGVEFEPSNSTPGRILTCEYCGRIINDATEKCTGCGAPATHRH